MRREFEQILDNNKVLHPSKHILVGVSGGIDSVVLLHLLQTISEKNRPNVSVAHINHQLREESDSDEKFVRKLADFYQLPFYSYTWHKEGHPDNGIEEAAREVRYTFFKELMNAYKNPVLMTAHHQDDQIETVFMKLARGSSLEQLTGIKLIQPFNNGQLLRPMLSFTKKQIYEYAKKHKIDYVEDASNLSLDFTRNRYRNQIIPLIKEENSRLNEHIEQFTKDIDDLLTLSKQPINEAFQNLIEISNEEIGFNYEPFFSLNESMQRAILKEILMKLYQDEVEQYKTGYIEMIRSWLTEGEVNTHLNLVNNFTVHKGYQNAIFKKTKEHKINSPTNEMFILNKINHWVKLSPNEKIGVFECKHKREEGIDTLIVPADKLKLPLTIRHRKNGDRMRYQGLSGTKKIKDIFIDEKVAPEKRDKAWLVENAVGQIIWLISYRKMDLLSALETDRITYVIKYKQT